MPKTRTHLYTAKVIGREKLLSLLKFFKPAGGTSGRCDYAPDGFLLRREMRRKGRRVFERTLSKALVIARYKVSQRRRKYDGLNFTAVRRAAGFRRSPSRPRRCRSWRRPSARRRG